jgi:outer membrane protein OmpA-like peptidoglycan-associated protein
MCVVFGTIYRMKHTTSNRHTLAQWLGMLLAITLVASYNLIPMKKQLYQMDQTTRGVEVKLNNNVMLFEFGKANLSHAATPYLDKLAFLILYKSSKQVAVEGFTDNIGSIEINQALSNARAKVVSEALQKRGVPAKRLKSAGLAFHRPVMSNSLEQGRALNRRAEITLLDETVDKLTDESSNNTFQLAFSKLKNMVDQGAIRPLS